jgi:hypothetical protein
MNARTLLAHGQALRAGAIARQPWIEGLPIVGIGWATVELDRAERELVGLGCSGWDRAPRDDLLGATARQCRGSSLRYVLLEPDTEGRVAASLARFGEGVAAVYLGRSDQPTGGGADAAEALSKPAPGTLGMARLLLGGPPWGPHVVVLEPGSLA